MDEEIISKLSNRFGNPNQFSKIAEQLKNRSSGILEEFLEKISDDPTALSSMHKYKHIKERIDKLQLN